MCSHLCGQTVAVIWYIKCWYKIVLMLMCHIVDCHDSLSLALYSILQFHKISSNKIIDNGLCPHSTTHSEYLILIVEQNVVGVSAVLGWLLCHPHGGNSRACCHWAVESWCQEISKHDFGYFQSLGQDTDGCVRLARCNLLLVFCVLT